MSTTFGPPHTAHDDVLAELVGQSLTSSKVGVDEMQAKSRNSDDDVSSIDGQANSDLDVDDSTPAAKEKDQGMWSHLSNILELQGEIAHMHVEMEGIGAKNSDGRRGATRKANQDWGVDGIEHDADEDADTVREEDFAALASKFAGRKADIDKIMNKLDELSHASTSFHAIKAPSLTLMSKQNQGASGHHDNLTTRQAAFRHTGPSSSNTNVSAPQTTSQSAFLDTTSGKSQLTPTPALFAPTGSGTLPQQSQPIRLTDSPVSVDHQTF